MSKKIKYEGKDKSFEVPKRRRKYKRGAVLFFSILAFMISLILGTIALVNGYTFEDKSNDVTYSEIGSSNYKVYLKENSYFEQAYLGEDMAYISDIINSINVSFNYSYKSSDILNYNYDNKVTATLYINDSVTDKELFKEEEILLELEKEELSSDKFNFNKDVDIDYDKYNEKVNALKKEYGVQIESKLVVTMDIATTGSDLDENAEFSKNNSMSVEIPLSEQTININSINKNILEEGTLNVTNEMGISNLFLVILSAIFYGIATLYLAKCIKTYIQIINKRDLYQLTIKKYLREYDRMIVTSSQPDLNENVFENKIRVMSIEELIDAHDSTGSPIVYYEVIPNEKSYFIIINGLTLYKLTISRAYLEQHKNGKN